ncbi:5-aminolevulinate synthase [Actinacidiphila yeochonensis]|uniref:5-aminolevulinate synthase n=1 Tax=Actinacidiphila yeochonensis TaxID=89050 RepID=UPI00056A65F4|nr:5-aminolevulinate synthase [Actinacidiphila yeochonensis]
MFDYRGHFSLRLDELRATGGYRNFLDIERVAGSFPAAIRHRGAGEPQPVTVWCSNDYLGMGQHPEVLAAMRATLDATGAGSGGSRNISGTSHLHGRLEAELADLHGKESALLFPSGYSANDAALTVLGRLLPGAVILSDALNHASLIAGIRHSGADKRVFRHNDAAHLDSLLAEIPRDRPKVVVLESVYSMDGDIAPLRELAAVARRHGALTFLDEVHAVGIYGPRGAGIAARDGVAGGFDVVMGTLAKAFGVAGGYIAGDAEIVDAVRSFASAFIFTTSPAPVVVAGALAAVVHLKRSTVERDVLFRHSALLHRLLRQARIPVVSDATHLVPVLVGDARQCARIAADLLEEYGLYVQPINAPSVPAGTERLRVTPTPAHTPERIEEFATALDKLWTRHGLPRLEAPRVADRSDALLLTH